MLIDATILSAIAVATLIVVTLCAISDVTEHRIYNRVLLPTLLLAFLLNSLFAGLHGIVNSLLGLVLGMAILFPLYFLRGTSAGDVKLLGVVGALLGPEGAMIAGIATICFGGVLGILFVVWRVIEPILGAQIAQIIGQNGLGERLAIQMTSGDKPWKAVFPYAPAIACGSYFALWHLGYFSTVLG